MFWGHIGTADLVQFEPDESSLLTDNMLDIDRHYWLDIITAVGGLIVEAVYYIVTSVPVLTVPVSVPDGSRKLEQDGWRMAWWYSSAAKSRALAVTHS